MSPYEQWLVDQSGIQQTQERKSAESVLRDFLATYKLDTMLPKVMEWLAQGYSDPTTLMTFVRAEPEYAQRFPAMSARRDSGNPITEADYIGFEQTAAELSQYYGLTNGLLGDDEITQLIVGNVSALELKDRVDTAMDAAMAAPKEVRDSLQRLYGANTGDIASYYLDPERSVGLIKSQYAAAKAAGGAQAAGRAVDAATAERMAQAGLDYTDSANRWRQVESMENLTGGMGEKVTDAGLTEGLVFDSLEAQQNLARIAGARAAQFSGGGGFGVTQEGSTLGVAGT